MIKDDFVEELQSYFPSVVNAKTKGNKLFVIMQDGRELSVAKYTTKPYTRKNISCAVLEIQSDNLLQRLIKARRD